QHPARRRTVAIPALAVARAEPAGAVFTVRLRAADSVIHRAGDLVGNAVGARQNALGHRLRPRAGEVAHRARPVRRARAAAVTRGGEAADEVFTHLAFRHAGHVAPDAGATSRIGAT